MKVLNKILGDGASKLLESAGSIVDNLVTSVPVSELLIPTILRL